MQANEPAANGDSQVAAEEPDKGAEAAPATPEPATARPAAPAAPASGGSGWLLYTGLFGAALAGLLYLRRRPPARPARRGTAPARRKTAQPPRRTTSKPDWDDDPPVVEIRVPPPSAAPRAAEPTLQAEALSVSDFHQNVAELLLAVLQREPRRSDLRWKLLEAHYFGGQVEAFIEQARQYKRYRKTQDEHWPSIVRMGRFLAPDCELFDQAEAEAAAGIGAAPAASPANRRFHEAIAPQRLRPALARLSEAYARLRAHSGFRPALADEFRHVLGRPTPFMRVEGFDLPAGVELYLKREDLRGANDYRMQNAVGQVLLAQKLGAQRVVAGTLNGQHGLAVALAAARRGLNCTVHVSEKLVANTEVMGRLRELRAEIQLPRRSLSANLVEPRQSALMDWLDNEQTSYFVCGLTGTAAPYPNIVFDLMALIGEEAVRQLRGRTQAPLRRVAASAGGGMETFGLLTPFLNDPAVEIVLADNPPAGAEGAPPRTSFAREYNWLADSSRVSRQPPDTAMARSCQETVKSTHALQLSRADAGTLAVALDHAAALEHGGSIVAMVGTAD